MAYGKDEYPRDDPAALAKMWLEKLDEALVWREKQPTAAKQWKRGRRLFRGEHWDEDVRLEEASSEFPRDRITVNVIGSTVRDFMAFLFKHKPKFLLPPRKKDAVVRARLKAALVNYWWREKAWVRVVRRCVWDYLIVGHGIAKTGWAFEIDESAKAKDGLLELNEAIRKEEPFVRRVPPERFVIDPEAPDADIHTAAWVAECFHRPLCDVLVTERYNKDVRAGIKSGKYQPKFVESPLDLPGNGDGANDFSAKELKSLVRVWEVWDKKHQCVLTLIDGIEYPVVKKNWPYAYLDGFPFVWIGYDEIPGEMYPTGLPYALEDQQLELNRIRTCEFDHRRKNAVRMWAASNAVTPEEETKLQMGQDGTVVKMPSPESVKPLQGAPLPEDNYRVQETIMADMRLLSGSDQLTQGGDLPSRTSATEISARQEYTGRKIEMRVEAVDRFLTDITRQIVQHMEANLTKAQAVRVEGLQGRMWAEVGPDDIRDETDLEIVTVSAERVDEQAEKQIATQVLDRILNAVPVLQGAGYEVDVGGLFRWFFETKMGVLEFDEFVKRIPPAPQAAGGIGGAASGELPPEIPPEQQQIQQDAVHPNSATLGAMGGY
jgi:hypothetical protein